MNAPHPLYSPWKSLRRLFLGWQRPRTPLFLLPRRLLVLAPPPGVGPKFPWLPNSLMPRWIHMLPIAHSFTHVVIGVMCISALSVDKQPVLFLVVCAAMVRNNQIITGTTKIEKTKNMIYSGTWFLKSASVVRHEPEGLRGDQIIPITPSPVVPLPELLPMFPIHSPPIISLDHVR